MPPKKGKEKEAKGKGKAPAVKLDVKNVKPKKIPPPPACFSPEDLARFKELFKTYDEENIDKVALKHIPHMLRLLGFNPKGAEVKELFRLFLEDDLVDTVEFHEFLFMIEQKKNWGDDLEADVIKAFGFLGEDRGEPPTGFCNMETLREALFEWGEPLEEPEWVDMPKTALKEKLLVFETSQFNYSKYVDKMNEKDAESKFTKEPVNYWKFDQATLAAMAIAKAEEERAEMERRAEERRQREEARRQRMIEQGLILEDDVVPAGAAASSVMG